MDNLCYSPSPYFGKFFYELAFLKFLINLIFSFYSNLYLVSFGCFLLSSIINEKQSKQMNKLISKQTKILGLYFLKALL